MREKSNYPRLTSKLLALSTADDYEDAKLEWRITGNVWKHGINEESRLGLRVRDHVSGHPNHCLCGHPIVYHFEIENTKTNVLEIVGSSCISNWMVLRHMSEKLKIDKRTITEEMIAEWKQTAVQSLIKDAWWAEEGDDFTTEFNNLKDVDLRFNVKTTHQTYWDDMLKEYRPVTYIRKSSGGTYGHPDYEMASIVWRWNHPENKKSQMNSKRGIPNDRLLNDMSLFRLKMDSLNERLSVELQSDRHRTVELANLSLDIIDRIKTINESDVEQIVFLKGCNHFGIRPFTTGEAQNDWERRFLRDMRRYVRDQRKPSEKQIGTLIKILRRENNIPLADKET